MLDLDVRKYFDSIPFTELRSILAKRVTDGVVRRMIDKWLKAGVLDKGQLLYPKTGTPQGGVLSPILSNVYLHHVLDVWFAEQAQPRHTWRQMRDSSNSAALSCGFEFSLLEPT